MWCVAVQESVNFLKWPYSVSNTWAEEKSDDGHQVIFRGPRCGLLVRMTGIDVNMIMRHECAVQPLTRIKMGVCEGYPGSIRPDYLGRADYFGTSVNEAARFMDAG